MQAGGENMATSRGYSGVLKERGFVFLLAAQALAVFDDNTFKQLLMLFVTASIPSLATRNLYISLGTALYVLPYIVFSSYAGQVADHFSKRRVIIFMKVVEATLLVVATFAMFIGHVSGDAGGALPAGDSRVLPRSRKGRNSAADLS
jgi:MFS family permease